MKKYYFLSGTVIGLVAAVALLAFMGGSAGLQMLTYNAKFNGLLPAVLGSIVALGVAYFFDRQVFPRTFLNKVFIVPIFILMCASLVGCLANYFVNGYPNEFYDYFTRPIWALGLFGFPACVVVSLVWHFTNSHLTKELA